MSNYDLLLSFVAAHKANVQAAAMAINAWIYSSKLPGGYGRTPVNAVDAAEDGTGLSCGWREVLFKSLFEDAGISVRVVNFYNMPFQGNHTTLEVYSNGKWMWFDPTFGTYFTLNGKSDPISVEAARANWPNVSIMKADVPGWTGDFQDLESLLGADVYTSYKDRFFYQPVEFAGRTDRISADIDSLYFGASSKYFPEMTSISGGSYVFKRSVSQPGINYYIDWRNYDSVSQKNEKFDSKGALISSWGDSFVNSLYTSWFKEFDPYSNYSWKEKQFYVYGQYSDYDVTIFDDGSYIHKDVDVLGKYLWTTKTTIKTYDGKVAAIETVEDNSSSMAKIFDVGGIFGWDYQVI
jgi:hypothetical protein